MSTNANSFRDRQKLKTFEEWIQQGDVFVQFDTRKAGTEVPENYHGQAALTLKFSNQFNTAPSYDELALVQQLKFGGEYFRCVVPWSAVWGMNLEAGESKLWQQDFPPELLVEIAKNKLRDFKDRLFGKKPALQTELGQTELGQTELGQTELGQTAREPERKDEKTEEKKSQKSHLRRIK